MACSKVYSKLFRKSKNCGHTHHEKTLFEKRHDMFSLMSKDFEPLWSKIMYGKTFHSTVSRKMKKSGQLLEIDELLVDVWGKLEVNAPSIGLYWPFWFSYPATMPLNDFGWVLLLRESLHTGIQFGQGQEAKGAKEV